MKRRIDQHQGGALAAARDPVERIAGHNVKLGEGGIREIEFLAQTLQLVWGGRDPGLRVPDHACRAAAAGARRPHAAPRRDRTGHRLSLPAPGRTPPADGGRSADPRTAGAAGRAGARSPPSWATPTPPAFATELLRHLGQVRAHYAEVFELVPELLTRGESAPGTRFQRRRCRAGRTTAALRSLGFANPDRIVSRGARLAGGPRRAPCARRAPAN